VVGATNYEFRFTDQASGAVFTKLRGIGQPNMLLANVAGLQYGATYIVDVRAYQSSTAGTYGTVCSVQIGSMVPPSTELQPGICGNTVSFGTLFFCVPVSGATNYE